MKRNITRVHVPAAKARPNLPTVVKLTSSHSRAMPSHAVSAGRAAGTPGKKTGFRAK